MKPYTLKYKRKNQFFFKTVKNIIGDELVITNGFHHMAFHIEDKSIIEIPIQGTEFKYSKERYYQIIDRKEKQTGLDLKTE